MKKQKSEDGMAGNKPVFVLDSFAVLAHFQAEDDSERVLELLENAREDKLELAMSLINVGKVVYLAARNRGKKIAEALLKDLRDLPIKFYEAGEERILAAAWIKASHAISYMQIPLLFNWRRNSKALLSLAIRNLRA